MTTPIGDNVVVIDYDDDFVKAGYCIPERDPQVVLPSAVRSPGSSHVARPIHRRQVQDWDQLETLLAHVFYKELGWTVGDEGAVLMSEPLFTSRADRERHCQMMFESFNVSGYYVEQSPVLALYGMGKTLGVSVDVGYCVTDVAPVIDGAVAHHAARRCEVGSKEVTNVLLNSFGDKHQNLTEAELDAVRDAVCVVMASCSTTDTAETPPSASYALPDGNTITVGGEARARCAEGLLSGSNGGSANSPNSHGGVSDALISAIGACAYEHRLACIDAIAVSGGWAGGAGRKAGFEERVVADLAAASPPSARPVAAGTPEHMPPNASRYSAWFGGALLGKVVFPLNHHVTKFEYQENGPGIVTKAGR
jgi:actin-related protein 7